MTKAVRQIEELELEIAGAAGVKAVIVNYLRNNCSDPNVRQLLSEQADILTSGIERRQKMIAHIETEHFAEIARARRAAKYPPIPEVKKSTIRFADEPVIGGQSAIGKILILGSRFGNHQALKEARR